VIATEVADCDREIRSQDQNIVRRRPVIVADKPALMPCHPLHADERNTVMNAIVAAYPETGVRGRQALEGGLVIGWTTGPRER